MERTDKILYSLGWPWGVRRGVRIDPDLPEDYPVLLLRGEGCSVVSLAPEFGEAERAVRDYVLERETVGGTGLKDFLFDPDAPAAVETALFLVPGCEGVRGIPPAEGTRIRFGLKERDLEPVRKAVPEREWMTGGIAPFARAAGLYDREGTLAAVAGGRLQGGVLDLTVLTRPDARGLGYAGMALTAMIGAYPEALPLWRTEAGNTASVRLAGKMGFEPLLVQEGIYLRLPED